MREQVTARHGVPQPELRPQRSQSVLGLSVPLSSRLRRNFHDKVVVCITGETDRELLGPIHKSASSPVKAVTRHLVLEVHLRDRRSDVVRVQTLVGADMLEPDLAASENMLQRQVFPWVRDWTVRR